VGGAGTVVVDVAGTMDIAVVVPWLVADMGVGFVVGTGLSGAWV
jgi:hypothetical protein